MPGYLFDTHIHTEEVSPCGRIPAAALVQLYKKAGYRGIIITDHFSAFGLQAFSEKDWQQAVAGYNRGYKLAREQGAACGLTVLWGLELSFDGSDKNDYLVYGVDEQFLLEHNNLIGLDLQALRQLADRHNLMIFQAHPFRPGMQPAAPQLLDGVEVYNGNPRHNSSNHLALAFAEEHSLLKIAGSDAHQPGDVGMAGIYLPEPVETIGEFMQFMKMQKDVRLWRRDDF